jgi:hypothetical protein
MYLDISKGESYMENKIGISIKKIEGSIRQNAPSVNKICTL